MALQLALLAAALAAAPLPSVAVSGRDPAGCARLALLRAPGEAPSALPSPAGLCVREAFMARLEDPGTANVVLQVDLPARPERAALFVYRLEGSRLVPRFLGSGFSSLEIRRARPVPDGPLDALEVETTDVHGAPRALTCRFAGFPLSCEEAPAHSKEP